MDEPPVNFLREYLAGNLIVASTVAWRCPVCEEVVPAGVVHRHDGPLPERDRTVAPDPAALQHQVTGGEQHPHHEPGLAGNVDLQEREAQLSDAQHDESART